ncbi:hypothetical protein BOX15_Mlig031153g1 [Macrostomum lignano]|uniref:Sperm-tail PG-rich repeat-containing protein 2 n=2 Tax=Macrostomum lignano TaxID=282301 RepID=A0A267EB22_9PLAT|nr:hypothetical protein BOX15_Mlig031153g1 [Macrostomum lignano]
MYDRARRDFSFQGNAVTDIHVGPGAYDTDKPARTKIRADGYAPFNSLSTRDNFLTPNDAIVAAPGPGQYNVLSGSGQSAVVGGSSLANRSLRFVERREVAPGPADYTVQVAAIKVAPPSDASAAQHQQRGSRVRFKRVDDAPSIPFPGQAYGFEENEHGLLVKQPAPDRDTSLGPAFYRVSGGAGSEGGYKGCHWSKSRARRADFTSGASAAGPGPGDYDIGGETQRAHVVHMNVRDGKPPAELRVPRYNEMLERQAARNPVPGPGAYGVRGHFDEVGALSEAAVANGDSAERPPFGVQSRRFGSAKEATPGPGAYSDPRTALTALKRGAGAHLKKSPFGNTAIRFQDDSGVRLMPGPGAYTVNSGMLAADSMKKVFLGASQKGAFGSTAVRMQPFVRKTEADRPGPASYEVRDRPNFQSKYNQPRSSMFASLTNRDFDPVLAEKSEQPHPAMYDVDRAFHKLHDRQQGYGPRNEAAKKRQSFYTSSDRFAGKTTGGFGGDPDMPGPASYNVAAGMDRRGAAPVREGRFLDKKDDAPAPNHYHISPAVESSVLRSTHNTTLGNPVKLLAKDTAPQTATNSYIIRA